MRSLGKGLSFTLIGADFAAAGRHHELASTASRAARRMHDQLHRQGERNELAAEAGGRFRKPRAKSPGVVLADSSNCTVSMTSVSRIPFPLVNQDNRPFTASGAAFRFHDAVPSSSSPSSWLVRFSLSPIEARLRGAPRGNLGAPSRCEAPLRHRHSELPAQNLSPINPR